MKYKYIIYTIVSFLITTPFVMAEEAKPAAKVTNRGVPSQNSNGGWNDFRKHVLGSDADWVLIYYGLNDTLNEKQFVELPRFVSNLTRMVDQAKEEKITPVLCTIHHSEEVALLKRHKLEVYGDERPNEKIDRYNEAIRNLAKEKDVALADFAKVSQASDGKIEWLSKDGVHLTPEGYQLLADTFHQAMGSNFEKGDKVICLGDSVTFGSNVTGKGTIEGDTYPAALSKSINGK